MTAVADSLRPVLRSVRPVLRSQAFLGVYLATTVLFLCEAGTRTLFALEAGARVMLYGTSWYRNTSGDENEERWSKTKNDRDYKAGITAHLSAEERTDSVERHLNENAGYTKFFPNEHKTTRDVDTGERIPVTINRHGLRGKEFEPTKASGVIRVLTLGSSSTFGFYDRDHETYPFYLEQVLNQKCGATRHFEVINFAVPHATSENIAAMFRAEGVVLSPDVVTFYEGRNDSTLVQTYDGFWEKAYAVLVHRVLLAAFLDQAIYGNRLSVTSAAEHFEAHARKVQAFFLGNVQEIFETARQHGVQMIVANQQATSAAPYPRPAAERERLRGVSYRQETANIKAKMKAGKEITAYEHAMLMHERLMDGLARWANERGVPLVDVIGALDRDRQHLLSWVHLHPDANRVIAEKLAEPILAKHCPQSN